MPTSYLLPKPTGPTHPLQQSVTAYVCIYTIAGTNPSDRAAAASKIGSTAPGAAYADCYCKFVGPI
jgi:hypothetical protein